MEAKKTPQADLTRKTGLFLNIGLAVSIGLTLFAFEYKSYDDGELMDLGSVNDEFEELLEIPLTEQPPPPPPEIQQPEVKEVEDEIEIEEEIEINFDVDVKEDTKVAEIIVAEGPAEEKTDEIFEFVETSPEPAGGMEGWMKYLSKETKYPTQARRMGIEGTVYVAFVIETDGSITDVQVIRGIEGGCNEEAIRVVENAPKWTPGKQRGRPVRVRMRLPIRFKLG